MDQFQPHPNTPGLSQLIAAEVAKQLQSGLFTARKLTDTPTDNLQVVNRRFVTLNGPSTNRPSGSVMGQQYFDTTLASGRGKTITWNGIGFVDATGVYV